ncbi:MAG TPA: uroporphyrinogen decarboxylase family protein [Tissierellaceae bacterium]|nr:uroporphyrinogen decarboxylase family protein [Tissierellaceae bacterium]
MIKNPEKLSKERYDRTVAAYNLEEPDRVPLAGFGGDVIPAFAGITQQEYAYDYDKAVAASIKYMKEFPFDSAPMPIPGLDGRIFNIAFSDYDDLSSRLTFITGPMHDVLADKYYRYPGNETSVDASPQFLGGTFMEPDEYDELIADPIKFINETIMPRVSPNLATTRDAMATWTRLGIEIEKFGAAGGKFGAEAAKLGAPNLPLGGAYAPLDLIGDFLRGIDRVTLDLRRYPEKVKAAAEALVDPIVKYALTFKEMGMEYVMIPLHLNEYLSPKLYKEFYWPTLKEVILRLGKEGLKSWVFFEGYHDVHLETILELPKGWGVAYFEKTDIVKAKKMLQGHTCVMGGLPVNLIIGGTPETIDEYIKELMPQVKPGGGFVLAASVGTLPATTPLENIKAVIDAVEKYGKY